ncbi:MAG TPA: MotA/TolQ/ExbB proton channel family protein [Pirellulales bacterium]|nr:MotA/TolQ/ExbB proton channel family protein [Pirellulales bacterium]
MNSFPFAGVGAKGLRFPSLLVVPLCLGGLFFAQLHAEDAQPAAEAKAETAMKDSAAGPDASTGAKKPPGNLWEMIVAGGPMNLAFMGFLGLISLVAAAVTFERLANLTRGKVVPPALAQALNELLRTGDQRLEKYQAICDQHPSPFAKILRAGLARAGWTPAEIEKALEDAVAREMAELRARVRPLSVAANVAPMVGLLGTVVGMLEAFRVASQAGLGKAELLAEGIYLALETTVAGLLIAIPAMLCAAYFGSRSERFVREIDDHLTDALPTLAQVKERTGGRPANANPLLGSSS